MHGTSLKAKSRASPVPVAPPPIINTWVSKQFTPHGKRLKRYFVVLSCNKALIGSDKATCSSVAHQGLLSKTQSLIEISSKSSFKRKTAIYQPIIASQIGDWQ
jgi:hypothetical protein